MAIELTPQEKSHVWWSGAIKSAIHGIPQGLMLGALSAVVLFGAIVALNAIFPAFAFGLAHAMGGFLFSSSAAAAVGSAAHAIPAAALSLSALNLVPFMAFNVVGSMIGNFMTGGKIALGDYQQRVDHARNEVRIGELETREQLVEQAIGVNPKLQTILNRGPRTVESFAAAEESRGAEGQRALS
jgi:hypothetical protein